MNLGARRHMRVFRYVYLIVGVCLVVMGAFVAYSSTMTLSNALATRSWPSVPGRITSAKVVTARGTRTTTSAPEIRYTYTVAGTNHEGARLEFATYAATTSYASDAVAEFSEGSDVVVYYDPARPMSAVLRKGANWLAWSLPFISVVFVVFGAALVRLGMQLVRTKSAA